MRVLFVAPRYYPHVGGVEYVVKSLATRLVRMSCKVTVLCGESEIDRPREEELDGVYVIRWPTLSLNNAYHVPRLRARLEGLLRELAKTHDVIHIHSAHAVLPVEAGLKIKQYEPNTKLVFTLHYHGTGHSVTRRVLWTLWRRKVSKLIEKANIVHAVSNYEAQLIEKHYPHSKQKIIVIPNGVDEDVFRYRWKGQNSDYMIYAGRIEKYKRLELAIDLAKQLGLKLLILGEGPHKKKLVKYAEKHYSNKVEFLSPQPRHRYLELLANARYAINPSEKEAYSIFIAEALAIGVPCIVSKIIVKILNMNYPMTTLKNQLVITSNTDRSCIVIDWNTIVLSLAREIYTRSGYSYTV